MEFENLLFTTDDWGISPGVNRGILELAKLGLVKRVSVLANGAYLDFQLEELKKVEGLEIGIHFNCTFGKANGEFKNLTAANQFLTLRNLAVRLFTKDKETLSEISKNLAWQLSLLQERGISPSYLDGHHHIHLFPGVFKAILPVLKTTKIKTIRTVLDLKNPSPKKLVLFVLSKFLKSRLLRAGFKTLPCYYPEISDITQKNFSFISVPTEVIIHPALEMDFEALKIKDSYQVGRVAEFSRLKALCC